MREELQGARSAAMIAEPIIHVMIVASQAARVDADRLKGCGLAYHERQVDMFCWIGPPQRSYDGGSIVKVLPLTLAQPRPNMKIEALDGERYLLPHDFRGTWFDVTSPKGVSLIP
jgi:hypothetical protein